MPAHRPYTQWTADTEIAFILALKLHGRPKAAAAALGRTVAGAYLRRRRIPDFAAKWEAALDEWRRRNAAALAPPPADRDDPPVEAHFDGFTKQRRRAFLRKLGDTGDVEAACRYVGLTPAGAYQVRHKDPAFAAAWDRALGQSVAMLEQAAIDRAIGGVEEEVWHAGRKVGTRRHYPEGLTRQLLADKTRRELSDAAAKEREKAAKRAAKRAARRAEAREHRPDPSLKQVSMEEVEAALLKNLDGLARGQQREKARADAAQAAAFRASWGAFGRARDAATVPEQDVLPPLADGEDGPGMRLA